MLAKQSEVLVLVMVRLEAIQRTPKEVPPVRHYGKVAKSDPQYLEVVRRPVQVAKPNPVVRQPIVCFRCGGPHLKRVPSTETSKEPAWGTNGSRKWRTSGPVLLKSNTVVGRVNFPVRNAGHNYFWTTSEMTSNQKKTFDGALIRLILFRGRE